MEVIVVSSTHEVPQEVGEVVQMFEMGLKYFHVHKPKLNRKQLLEYLEQFPEEYRSKLVLHSYHGLAFKLKLGGIHLTRKHRKRGRLYYFRLWIRRKLNPNLIVSRSFHKLSDLTNDKRKYSYAFLSPVFDSISHSSLSAGFSKRALLIVIPQARQPVYAMGGISEEKFDYIHNHGFDGMALHGTVWEGKIPPSAVFRSAFEKAIQIR